MSNESAWQKARPFDSDSRPCIKRRGQLSGLSSWLISLAPEISGIMSNYRTWKVILFLNKPSALHVFIRRSTQTKWLPR